MAAGKDAETIEEAIFAVAPIAPADDNRKAILAALEKLRDKSHTVVGASDDYKEGRAMSIQLCINELIRGER